MAAASIQLFAGKGEAVTYNGTHYTDATKATVKDISGWTIVVTARDPVTNAVVLTKTASVTSGPSGTYSFAVTHANTLLALANYAIDIQRTDSGSETLMAYGTWQIGPEVLY